MKIYIAIMVISVLSGCANLLNPCGPSEEDKATCSTLMYINMSK